MFNQVIERISLSLFLSNVFTSIVLYLKDRLGRWARFKHHFFPIVCPRQVCACACSSLVIYTGLKPRLLKSQFSSIQTKVIKSHVTPQWCNMSIKCVFSSHSNGDRSTDENLNKKDKEYVNKKEFYMRSGLSYEAYKRTTFRKDWW